MYAEFKGKTLISSFRDVRLQILSDIREEARPIGTADHYFACLVLPFFKKAYAKRAGVIKQETIFLKLLNYDDQAEMPQYEMQYQKPKLEELSGLLANIQITENIQTHALLEGLISAQLIEGRNEDLIKLWLDRVIQRFEVTKKLYQSYKPGFRKGEGINTSIVLYWLLALNLSLSYAKTSNIRYLSTLLKVCDLLLSLPRNEVFGHLSSVTMLSIFSTELLAVEVLEKEGGGS